MSTPIPAKSMTTAVSRVDGHLKVTGAAKYPADFNNFVQNEHDEEQVQIGPGLRLETSVLVETADFRLDASRPQVEVFKDLDTIVGKLLSA